MIYKQLNIDVNKIYYLPNKNKELKPIKVNKIYENKDDLDYYILYHVYYLETNQKTTAIILYETPNELI